jgi:hypothetical protein
MSNNLQNYGDDGFGRAAQESTSVIKGSLLKFLDSRWLAGNPGAVVSERREFAVQSVAIGWVLWKDGKPDKYEMVKGGARKKDREELGDTDENEWELDPGRGEPRDPWQDTMFLYLLDPQTAEAFTFPTSTFGGRSAVVELSEQIMRMRQARPGATPIVTLFYAPMKTKLGMKSKPAFNVVRWALPGGTQERVQPHERRQEVIPPERTMSPREANRVMHDMGDDDQQIPF